MNTLTLIMISFFGYLAAYRLYGRYLAKKIFMLSDKNKMPSGEFMDGVDFVPAKKSLVFGHHFTTIAGIGPIVGPAIGVIWGWLPAFLWVFFGSVFMGAVHDFSTLVISARNKGKTIGDLTGDIINQSTRYAFQFLIQFLLCVVLSVFAIIVSTLLVEHPEAVIPVWLQIPIAVWLGWQIRSGKKVAFYSAIAVIIMYMSIIAGSMHPIEIFPLLGSRKIAWSLILFIYVFFASTVPVNRLLQPRDYINSHQLLIAMILLVLGIIIARPSISAPAINPAAFEPGTDIPGLMPLLFITIACGAISGFHSLASSGTTVKQVEKESDTLSIGYGGMILEGFLAVIVIVAVTSGLGDAFADHYSSWKKFGTGMDISPKLNAFITGASNLLYSIHIPPKIAASLLAVFIVSFANTTLDSAARIQRLSLHEIFKSKKGKVVKPFNNRYLATIIVVVLASVLTYHELQAKRALELWRIFGALNQLLAALGLGMISIWLYHKKKNYLLSFIPMLFMLVVTIWAMVKNIIDFKASNTLLLVIAILILILTGWILISGIVSLINKRDSIPVSD